jgi:hypothetical protein
MKNINWFGLSAALICSLASLGLILDYSLSASTSPWRVALYAGVGVAAVAWEVTGLHRGNHLMRARRWGAMSLCYLGLAVAVLITVSYEIGSLAELLESKASIGESRASERGALEAERSMLLAQAKKAGEVRPEAAIRGDIAAIKAHPRWASSRECTDATAPESIDLCGRYAPLAAELGAAVAIAGATARITELNATLQPLAASKVADARASYLSKLSGLPEIDARIAVSVLIIAFLLFGRVAGGYVFMDSGERGAQMAHAYQSLTEAPGAPESLRATGVAQKTAPLPSAALLEPEEDDFDDAPTVEELDAMFNEQQALAELTAAIPPATAPTKRFDVDKFDPARVRNREIVERFAKDCLVLHIGDTDRRERGGLLRECYDLWRADMEISDGPAAQKFSIMLREWLEEQGGCVRKLSEHYYIGVTITPAYAHRLAEAADAVTANGESAFNLDGPRRLGGLLKDNRAIVMAGDVGGTA